MALATRGADEAAHRLAESNRGRPSLISRLSALRARSTRRRFTTGWVCAVACAAILLPVQTRAADRVNPTSGRPTAQTAETNRFERFELGPEWVVGDIEIEGHAHLDQGEVEKLVFTKTRPWYKFWQQRPAFEVAGFEADLERIARAHEAEGFYRVRVDWSAETHEDLVPPVVDLTIHIDEGPRAQVESVTIDAPDGFFEAPPAPLEWAQRESPLREQESQPTLEVGQAFSEPAYQGYEKTLLRRCLERSRPQCKVDRHAVVDVERTRVAVDYAVEVGPEARISEIVIEGYDEVARELIEREVAMDPGDLFSLREIDATRRRLTALDLFASVRIEWEPQPDGDVVLHITVREKAPRELRIGVGYSTEEDYRGQIRWRNANWLGGGRRVVASGRYSGLVSAADFRLVQPHFFDRRQRGILSASLFQEDERNYTRNSAQLVLAFERDLTPNLLLTLGFRLETAEVRDIDSELEARLDGVRREGRLFGPQLRLRWTPVDDLFNPTKGFIFNFFAEHSGAIYGATYRYYKITGQAAAFYPIYRDIVLATRLELGVVDQFGSSERLPIFERFYAGGERSVRGYQRRQLGPRAANGDPLGGRSLIEAAIELRIPVWKRLGVVAFLDGAQVSRERFDLYPDEARYSAGPGISYQTPVGPVSLFAGFPINDQPGEPEWQIHFSIGFFF